MVKSERGDKLEQFIEKAKDLVGGYKNVGISISDADASFIEEYAFYTDDFDRVEILAKELIDGDREAASNFIQKVKMEIGKKKSQIERFLNTTWQGSELIQSGNEILAKLKEFFGRENSLAEYEHYLKEQDTNKQGSIVREEFKARGEGGLVNVRGR